jgi:hypothetical protein
MGLVFQYGSNTSPRRLNGADRLRGAAEVLGLARTRERFVLSFDVWSRTNNCAAANLRRDGRGRVVWGVLYEIPEEFLARDTVPDGRRSFDAIESEGTNYIRAAIDVVDERGVETRVLTYLVREPKGGLRTSEAYVGHILSGLTEAGAPPEYVRYVKRRVRLNNPELTGWLRVQGRRNIP